MNGSGGHDQSRQTQTEKVSVSEKVRVDNSDDGMVDAIHIPHVIVIVPNGRDGQSGQGDGEMSKMGEGLTIIQTTMVTWWPILPHPPRRR